MRRAARDLALALALVAAAATEAPAAGSATFLQSFRALDGEQYLEDEPIWFCVEYGRQDVTGSPYAVELVGIEESGRAFRSRALAPMDYVAVVLRDSTGRPIPQPPLHFSRAGEFVSKFPTPTRGELQPLLTNPGLRAGRYEVRRTEGDTARAIATFQVIAPRGSELSVRAGLARANRILYGDDPDRLKQAATLVSAILERYPRSSYRTLAYRLAWALNSTFLQTGDSGEWLEELFAHFHDSCFGVWALEQADRMAPSPEFYVRLRRLVGIYPDTRLSRAAASML